MLPDPDAQQFSTMLQQLMDDGAYTRLDNVHISNRLRQLAQDITANASNDLEKAMALQEHLKANYVYSLDFQDIPKDREPVDYFLFESKTGTCRHFAQALTVLARLAGLPARLATGYAPGNFNLLSRTFEVYEYHAHAWTQIYVAPYGWLTFDGVPPGQLDLRTSPRLLRPFLDPFPKSLQARPPELAFRQWSPHRNGGNPQDRPPEIRMQLMQKVGQWQVEAFQRAMRENGNQRPTPKMFFKALLDNTLEGLGRWFDEQIDSLEDVADRLWTALSNGLSQLSQNLLDRIQHASIGDMLTMLLGVALFTAIFWKHRAIDRQLRRSWHLLWCRRHLAKLRRRTLSPQELINGCHHLQVRLLQFANIQRPPQTDMAEWADAIRPLFPQLAAHIDPVVQSATALWYSPTAPNEACAQMAMAATEQFAMEIRNLL
jgi:hypothetical protein